MNAEHSVYVTTHAHAADWQQLFLQAASDPPASTDAPRRFCWSWVLHPDHIEDRGSTSHRGCCTAQGQGECSQVWDAAVGGDAWNDAQ